MFQSILAIAVLLFTVSSPSLVKGQEVGTENFNWEITYMSVDADSTARGKVSLSYHISANRMYKVGVYERDCIIPITGAPIYTSQTMNVTPEHNGLEITLDLNESSIASRNVWERDTIQFCVKVRLLSVVGDSIIDGEEEVIKEDNRNFTFNFGTDSNLATRDTPNYLSVWLGFIIHCYLRTPEEIISYGYIGAATMIIMKGIIMHFFANTIVSYCHIAAAAIIIASFL